MAGQFYGNIWKVLSEYNFDIDLKLHGDLTCVICGKLLINAHQGPCGCRYCLACVTDYLGNGDRLCPCGSGDCAQQPMSMASNVHSDNAANRAISALAVACPEEMCQFSGELRSIDDHIRSHELRCPFADVGCTTPKMSLVAMAAHLGKDSYAHSAMMMETVRNSRNEMAALRDRSEERGRQFVQRLETVERANVALGDRVTLLEGENGDLRADVAMAMSRIDEMDKLAVGEQALVRRIDKQVDEVGIAHTVQLGQLERRLAKLVTKLRSMAPTTTRQEQEQEEEEAPLTAPVQQSLLASLPPSRGSMRTGSGLARSVTTTSHDPHRPIARARARPVDGANDDGVAMAAIAVLREQMARARDADDRMNEDVALLRQQVDQMRQEIDCNEVCHDGDDWVLGLLINNYW